MKRESIQVSEEVAKDIIYWPNEKTYFFCDLKKKLKKEKGVVLKNPFFSKKFQIGVEVTVTSNLSLKQSLFFKKEKGLNIFYSSEIDGHGNLCLVPRISIWLDDYGRVLEEKIAEGLGLKIIPIKLKEKIKKTYQDNNWWDEDLQMQTGVPKIIWQYESIVKKEE